jgi:ketosteroid isomerase-like protein
VVRAESNVEILQRAYAKLREGGPDAILEFIDPKFEAVAPPELSVEPQTYRGHEGVKRWFDSFYDAVDEVRIEPEEYIDAGEHVVTPIRIVVKGHESGIEVAQPVTFLWTMRSGRAVKLQPYPDKQAALRALGRNGPDPSGAAGGERPAG